MTAAAQKTRPFEAIALTALFALAICAPLVKQLLIGEPDTSFQEGRYMEQLPKLAGGFKWVIKTAPPQFNSYYNDHFGFRSFLLDAGTALKSQPIHSSNPAGAVGLDGWFFRVDNLTKSSTPLTEAALENWKRYLETREKWLAARGIKYLFIVPPDKETIYPEKLPEANRPPQGHMLIDQLIAYLKKTNSTVNVLSLRDAVLAGKSKEHQRLYYTLDDHWNSLGGFYGYEAVIQRLAEWYPEMKAKSRSDFSMTISNEDIPPYAKAIGPTLQPKFVSAAQKTSFSLPGFLNDWGASQPYTTELTHPGNLPKVVQLRDSFTIALAPYLSENFARITFLWPVLIPSQNNREIEKVVADVVLKAKPDVFIEERVQRLLSFPPDVSIVFGGDGKSGASVSGSNATNTQP